MAQTDRESEGQDRQPRDMAKPTSSPPSEDLHQLLPSPPGIYDNNQPSLHTPVALSSASPSDSEPGTMITLSQPIQEHGISTPPQASPDDGVDPRIASLHAIFPDFDDSLLLSVLQSVNGNQDQAIDTLLGMSDPDYTSSLPPPQVQQEPTQTELDEQLARRLMLEEEQSAQHQWGPPQHDQAPQFYQSRRVTTRGGGNDMGIYDNTAQRGNAPQRDTMAEFQDGFNKIAETGKKTFSSIVSKVKAKMQEFDQGYGSSRQDTQPTWGQPSRPSWSSEQPQTNTSSQSPYQSTYHEPNPQYQESYYDPNPPGESRIREIEYITQSSSSPHSSGDSSTPTLVPNTPSVAPNPIAKPEPNSLTMANSNSFTGSTMYTLPTASMGTPPPAEFARQSGDAPRPPLASAGTPSGIDPTKLGLLPKRPVSLLRDQTPMRQSHRDDSDDDDGLEYVENPFEERTR